MNKLQAAMRDRSAKTWRERKLYYKVGSIFKACLNCESTDVHRSYKPWAIGWTFKCFECNSTDARCWENPQRLGQEPLILTRSDMAEFKKQQRKEAYQKNKADEIAAEVAELRARIAELEGKNA